MVEVCGDAVSIQDNNRTLVSVIVPVYNTEPDLLHNCLSSIVNQKNDGISVECLVIFDGQPQQILCNVLKEFPAVQVLTIKHTGVSAARNEGIRQSTGEWIAFVDADDILPVHALLEMTRFGKQQDCDIVQGAYVNQLSTVREIHSYSTETALFFNENLHIFQEDLLIPDKGLSMVWSKIFRRQVLFLHKVYFDTDLNLGEDTVFVFEVVSHAQRIGFIPQIVYIYQRQSDSAVSTFRNDYIDCIDSALSAMQSRVHALADPSRYMNAYQAYVLFHLLLIQQHYIFNPDAQMTRTQKKATYHHVLAKKRYTEALNSEGIRAFPFAKKIALLALRFHAFSVSEVISLVRRHQLVNHDNDD